MHTITRLFTTHPDSVGESYVQHMRVAGYFGFWLGVAAIAALIHALIPACCETTASRIIGKLHGQMAARH